MRKCSWAMSGAFVACLTFAAHGSANVFDDAVFWFRGGKDISGDGCMQQGEFFDDLHADNDSHDNHKMSMTGYTGSYVGFKENAEFRGEQVVFPALGTSVTKEMQVLHISNAGKRSSGVAYYYPLVVNPHSIFESNNISNEYTVVSRIRMDELTRTECFLRLGYNSSAKRGMMLGFAKKDSGSKYIMGYCTADSASNNAEFRFEDIRIPTNTWVDVAIVVGNGTLRVGVALPVSGGNSTIAFAETPMWTDNCQLLANSYYRMFCQNGQSEPYTTATNALDKTSFVGSVQQLAIWGRALSDQEMMAAFGMPRPTVFRTGFDNGVSTEFGGTRSGATQTIDGLGSWQDVATTMLAGDEWTVNFDALRDEARLAQIFSLRSLPSSAPADIEVALNGTSLGTRRVHGNARVFWPVTNNLVSAGANILTIRRTDSGTGSFLMDAMELGGSFGVGTGAYTAIDGRVAADLNPTGIPSAADPNLQHWPQGLRPKTEVTNLHFRVWVDPDVVGVCSSKLRTVISCEAESEDVEPKDEKFSLLVNGIEEIERGASTNWDPIVVNFEAGKLLPGWNDVELKSARYTTCRWPVAYFRFETFLPRAFSLPPPGMTVFIK